MGRGESDEIELRFLIPSKIAGIIIGKSGENIKKLRKQYPVRITISENPGPERVMTIDGDINVSMEVIESILEREASSLSESTIDCRLLVHTSQAGIIIGKAGSKIREFRETSGLKSLKVYQTPCPCSTDRIVQLIGEIDNIVPCLQSIAELLKSSMPKGMVQYYDAGNFEEDLAVEYGGWSSQSVSGNSKRLNVGNEGSGQFSYYSPNKNMSQSNIPGTTAAMINDVLAGRIHANNSAPGNGHSGPSGDATTAAMMAAGMMRGIPNRLGMGMNLNPTTTTQVSISDKMIGAIMGKAGTRINQVRRESGAEIKISKHEAGVEDRIITITGTPDQIQNAQFLLQVCVKKYGDQM